MKRHLLFLTVFSLVLSACASSPAPIRDATRDHYGHDHLADDGDGLPFEPGIRAPGQVTPSAVPPQGDFVPDYTFSICEGLRVRNAPSSNTQNVISGYAQLFVMDQILALATVPLNGGCLSSGYGLRDRRAHNGIDISAPRGTWVYSAAPGIVREMDWGGGFGYYILIEHGYGIFTRYAHLDAFVEGLEVGSELGFGWPIGQVGNSSTHRIGVHLHYEVLKGDYTTVRKSFGLDTHDPFSFPVYIPPAS